MLNYTGAKCWVQLNKKHYGVCTGIGPDGDYWFIHNVRGRGVIHTTRKGFAGNRDIIVEQVPTPGMQWAVVERARSFLGTEYNMLFFNCEHLANLAVNGRIESKQVQDGVATAGVGTFLLALLTAAVNENGTWVDDNGYRRNSNGQFGSRRWW